MFFARIVQFPPRGRYAEGTVMRMILDDEEMDALAEIPNAEAYKVYIKVRRIMDFRTGIVGGPKRRTSWGEIADWLAVPADRGRKGSPASISHARRVVESMEHAGLVERRSGDQWLMLYLPMAYSDTSHRKRMAKDASYRKAVAGSIAEAESEGVVVVMDRMVANGDCISIQQPEIPLPVASQSAASLATASLPDASPMAGMIGCGGNHCEPAMGSGDGRADPDAAAGEDGTSDFRQTSDRVNHTDKQRVDDADGANSDNISENPFTPTHRNISIKTNNARVREGSGFSDFGNSPDCQKDGAGEDAASGREKRNQPIGAAVRQAIAVDRPGPGKPAVGTTAVGTTPAVRGTASRKNGGTVVNGVDIFDLEGAPPDWPYLHTHKIPKAAAFEHPDNPVERLFPGKQVVLGSLSKLTGGQSVSFPLKWLREDADWVKEVRATYLATNLGLEIPEYRDDPDWEARFKTELAGHEGALDCWARWWPQEAIDAGILPPEEVSR